MKNIAVVSSGTDNSGVNGAIRAIVRGAASHDARVFGIRWGFGGLVNDQLTRPLTSRDVSGKIGKAGCFLGTAKPHGILTPENVKIAIDNLHRRNIDKMIVIGGYRSLTAAQVFAKNGIHLVGIPSTIQDDIPGTDIALGVDSAVNNIVKCIEKIRSSSSSRDRSFLIQVEGRECGSLALRAAFVSGADYCLIPERPYDDSMERLKHLIEEANLKGKQQVITIIAAGWRPGTEALARYLEQAENETDLHVRTTVLGYVQRGGPPSGFDRLLGTEFGYGAVKAIIDGKDDIMMGVRNGQIVHVPFSEVIGVKKELDKKLFEAFRLTR